MNFELNKEQKIIIKNVREFMLKEIAPFAEEIDQNDQFPPRYLDKTGGNRPVGLEHFRKVRRQWL